MIRFWFIAGAEQDNQGKKTGLFHLLQASLMYFNFPLKSSEDARSMKRNYQVVACLKNCFRFSTDDVWICQMLDLYVHELMNNM